MDRALSGGQAVPALRPEVTGRLLAQPESPGAAWQQAGRERDQLPEEGLGVERARHRRAEHGPAGLTARLATGARHQVEQVLHGEHQDQEAEGLEHQRDRRPGLSDQDRERDQEPRGQRPQVPKARHHSRRGEEEQHLGVAGVGRAEQVDDDGHAGVGDGQDRFSAGDGPQARELGV